MNGKKPMTCPDRGTPLQYGNCPQCQEAKYLREERQAIANEPRLVRAKLGVADLPDYLPARRLPADQNASHQIVLTGRTEYPADWVSWVCPHCCWAQRGLSASFYPDWQSRLNEFEREHLAKCESRKGVDRCLKVAQSSARGFARRLLTLFTRWL
jgi:hypothetical protein